MTNHHTKLEEDPLAMISLVIDRTMFVHGPTDGHVQSNIPTLLHGRHNYYYFDMWHYFKELNETDSLNAAS